MPYINVQTALPIPAKTRLRVKSIIKTTAQNRSVVMPKVSLVKIYEVFLSLLLFLSFTVILRKAR